MAVNDLYNILSQYRISSANHLFCTLISLVSSISSASAARFDVELSPLVISEFAALALVIAGVSGSSSLTGWLAGTLFGV